MPGAVLHQGAVILCAHGGQATPTHPSSVVFVKGLPITTIAAPYSVSGCSFAPPAGNGPCATAQWISGAQQVLSQGQPVALLTGSATCLPTGTPLVPVSAQATVLAT